MEVRCHYFIWIKPRIELLHLLPSGETLNLIKESLILERGGELYSTGGWVRQVLEGVSVFDAPRM